MKMNRIPPVVILIILLATGIVQSQVSEKWLYGEWKGVKKELRDGNTGEDYTIDGKAYKANTILEFRRDGIVSDLLNKGEYKYRIKSNFLQIGNREYVIEKLNASELILLDYDSDHPDDPFAFRIFYKKKEKSKELE